MKPKYLLIIFLSLSNCYWWLYDTDDHNELFNTVASPIEKTFIEDQGICYTIYNNSCYLVNSKLKSNGTLINKCCLLKTSSEEFCSTIFSGKYFLGNLYSIDYDYDHNFTYDCDGDGDKTFSPSDYNPTEKWEIENKEKYDCIYSETEEQCKANPKSFKLNTKCCWFSNQEKYDMASCFGMRELTDEEFNKITPYITHARMFNYNKTMDFSCYDKTDNVKRGSYDLEFNYIMISSLEEKMAYELQSEIALFIFAKKQSFVGVKDYDYSAYNYNYFRMYTISPDGSIDKVFTISTRFRYKIIDDRRNLQQNDDGYIEKIIPCFPESVDTSTNLNLTLSKCEIEKEEVKEIEKIEIQKGNDLIGNFENGKNEIFEGQTFINESDLNKIKQTAIFTFEKPKPNIKSNIIKGETTEDRANINFVLYHTENSKVQTIQAKASFIKGNSSATFTMIPSINLKNGITIIPNQIAQNDNGEYLYFQNKVGTILDDEEEEEEEKEEKKKRKSKGLSKGILAVIIICSTLVLISIILLIVYLLKKKSPKKHETIQSEVIKSKEDVQT